ncbi:MarR family transcriptional regulator [Streptomyces sp. NPDC005262]|uniref:MarR family transcriptional regulator n=1 Tax=Streptomyces sp. NPDC005262 TaxID=3364710 RepID=UPI0036935CD2
MPVLRERGEAPVEDLAGALRPDNGTVSPLFERLQAAGLVRRVRSAADERSVLVEPTGEDASLRTRAERVPRLLPAAVGRGEGEVTRLRAELHVPVLRRHPGKHRRLDRAELNVTRGAAHLRRHAPWGDERECRSRRGRTGHGGGRIRTGQGRLHP